MLSRLAQLFSSNSCTTTGVENSLLNQHLLFHQQAVRVSKPWHMASVWEKEEDLKETAKLVLKIKEGLLCKLNICSTDEKNVKVNPLNSGRGYHSSAHSDLSVTTNWIKN